MSGSGNYIKTPLGETLNRIAIEVAKTVIQQLGKALPCSVVAVDGQIVTVKFEISTEFTIPQVTVPIAGAEYIRFPTQVGDTGVCFPASAYLGGITGLGGGIAGLTQPMNLEALVFFPIGKTSFFVVNPNALVLYGPDGVVLRDTGNRANMTLIPTMITMSLGSSILQMTTTTITLDADNVIINGMTISSAGVGAIPGPVTVTNDLIAGGISVVNHVNTGVTAGGANSGPPYPGS
jgi:hypothetical protein